MRCQCLLSFSSFDGLTEAIASPKMQVEQLIVVIALPRSRVVFSPIKSASLNFLGLTGSKSDLDLRLLINSILIFISQRYIASASQQQKVVKLGLSS